MDAIVARMLTGGARYRGRTESGFLPEFRATDNAQLRRMLLELEKASAATADPLRFLRGALLDYTEIYKVAELVADKQWEGESTEEERKVGVAMETLLAQRFEYARTPSACWTYRLSTKALGRYLEANYPDCFSSPWWEAYVSHVFDRVIWLERLIEDLAVLGIVVPGERTILPDEMILDQWTNWARETRTRALDAPDEFAASRLADIRSMGGFDPPWTLDR